MAIKTPAFIIDSLLDDIKAAQPELVDTVYSEELEFESIIKEFRAVKDRDKEDIPQVPSVENSVLPLLGYNRTGLEHSLKWQHRGQEVKGPVDNTDPENPTIPIYKALFGQFTINFLYLSKDIEGLEQFEVGYLAEFLNMSALKKAIVTWPQNIGDMTYRLEWGPLEDKEFEDKENSYSGLQGTLLVEGYYFLTSTPGKPIKIINYSIRKENDDRPNDDEIIFQDTINA